MRIVLSLVYISTVELSDPLVLVGDYNIFWGVLLIFGDLLVMVDNSSKTVLVTIFFSAESTSPL